MTRKTYRELAKEIGRLVAIEAGSGDSQTWGIINAMCGAMKSDNSAFDKERFIEAIEAERVAMQEVWEMRKKGMAAR